MGDELLASSKDVGGDSLVIDELAPAIVGLVALGLIREGLQSASRNAAIPTSQPRTDPTI